MDHEKFREGLLKAANSMVARSSGNLRLVCRKNGKDQIHHLELDNKPLGSAIESYVANGPYNQQQSLLNFLDQIVCPVAERFPKANKAGRKRLGIMMARLASNDFIFYEESY